MESSKHYIAKAVGAVIPFLAIGVAVYFVPTILTMFDYELGELFYNLRTPALNQIVRLITRLGDSIIQTGTTVVIMAFLILRKHYKVGIWFGVSVLFGAHFLNQMVKDFFMRPRPTEIAHLIAQDGYSFPSGHAMGTMIIYMGLLYIILRYTDLRWVHHLARLLCPLIIIVVGVSRIYLGVHFVSDVLAGWFLGLAWHYLALAVLEGLIDRPEVVDTDEHWYYYE